jgi:NitT/TauT family transport system substrate-binding protein
MPSRAVGPEDDTVTVRVGYFPNITHSQALIGMARGDFQQALGSRAKVEAKVFNAGPSVIEALFAGHLDLAYVGPNPAINGYVQSQGEALHIIAGASSGGAALVVRPDAGIAQPQDLAGKRLATPQLGNTQDVALRAYLKAHGLTLAEVGGNVTVLPNDNPQILNLFQRGQIDGAWVPEPWASRLILEGGGKLFLDERELWPNGDFVTAEVIASTAFLKDHPDIIKTWLDTHVQITTWEQEHPDQAKTIVNQEIERLTGKALSNQVIDSAWSHMRATYDPLSASLAASAEAAYAVGLLKRKPDLGGIHDLAILNGVLAEHNLATVK